MRQERVTSQRSVSVGRADRGPVSRSEVSLRVTDLPAADGSSEMELVLEKSLDFLLRPRADMWWLRKERLLVVRTDHSTEREEGNTRG